MNRGRNGLKNLINSVKEKLKLLTRPYEDEEDDLFFEAVDVVCGRCGSRDFFNCDGCAVIETKNNVMRKKKS